jgi:hypothetical protein
MEYLIEKARGEGLQDFEKIERQNCKRIGKTCSAYPLQNTSTISARTIWKIFGWVQNLMIKKFRSI